MPKFVEYLLVAILGWTCGALVNYLTDVLPLRRKFTAPFCQKCGENLPIINYLFWPRRCSSCGQPRRWRTWLVEILGIAAMLWLWITPPAKLGFVLGAMVLFYFAIVTIIDLEYRLILHPVSIAGVVLGLTVGVLIHPWYEAVLGGVIGFGVMLFFYYLGTIFARWMAKRRKVELGGEALGFGDVNLSGVLGLLLGSWSILMWLVISAILGAVISLVYMAVMASTRRYRIFAAIPYGPFLVAGAFIFLYLPGLVKIILAR